MKFAQDFWEHYSRGNYIMGIEGTWAGPTPSMPPKYPEETRIAGLIFRDHQGIMLVDIPVNLVAHGT